MRAFKVGAALAAVVCLGGLASVTAGHHRGGCGGGWGGGYSNCGYGGGYYGGGYSGGCGSYSGYRGGYGGWNSCGGGWNSCGYGYSHGGCGSYGYSSGCAGGACGLPSGGHTWHQGSGDGYVRSTIIRTTPTVTTQGVTPTALQVSTTSPAAAQPLKWY